MENLAFHSFTQMKDDYTTNSHYLINFSWKGCENVLFELGSERINGRSFTLSFFVHSCLENCSPKASLSKRTVIGVQCERTSCEADVIRYDWSLRVFRNQTWHATGNLDEIASGEVNRPRLIFSGRVFLAEKAKQPLEHGMQYKVTVKMHITGGTLIEEELLFITDKPPNTTNDKGCAVNPSVGYTLETVFEMSCSGWQDEDLPLTYEFRYRSTKSVVVIQSGPQSRAEAKLPPGNPHKGYNFTLEILVKDSLGSFAMQEITLKVAVYPLSYISFMLCL